MPVSKFVDAIRQWTLNSISIRLRLALWYGSLLFVTLTLFSVIVFAVAEFQLESSVDQGLQVNAQSIAHTIRNDLRSARDSTGTSTPFATQPAATTTEAPAPTKAASPEATQQSVTPTATPVPTVDPAQQNKIQSQLQLSGSTRDLLGSLDLTFEVLNFNGTIDYIATNIRPNGLHIDPSAVDTALSHGSCTAYDFSQKGSQLRVYVYPVIIPSSTSTGSMPTGNDCTGTTGGKVVGAVLVAKTVNDVNGSLNTLGRLLVIGVIIATIFTTMGSWFIAGSSLQPISKVTRIARAIAVNAHGAGLGRRVDYSGPRDEVGELAGTFDDMLAAIEHVTSAQRRFVADASHELRAPLTSIKGNLEFLRMARNASEEARSEAVEDAYAEAERMTRLVNDLLLLARADAAAGGTPGSGAARLDDQMRGRREPVELDQLAMDIFRTARAQIQAGRRTRLQLAIQRLEPVAVMADPGQLRQVMMILLDNAIKYTPEGGKVRISAVREDGKAAISVSDTGIGIEPEVMPHIFERFYRGDSARARDEHGSGLGLAIADWIVRAHNGEIRITSEPGKGSTFSVLLPALKRAGELSSAKLPIPRIRKSGRNAMVEAIAPLARLANTVSRPRAGDSKNSRKTKE